MLLLLGRTTFGFSIIISIAILTCWWLGRVGGLLVGVGVRIVGQPLLGMQLEYVEERLCLLHALADLAVHVVHVQVVLGRELHQRRAEQGAQILQAHHVLVRMAGYAGK